MQNVLITFISFLLLSGNLAKAQTTSAPRDARQHHDVDLDQLLDQHAHAMGGAEAWKNFNTHLIVHDSQQGDKNYSSTLYMKMPNKFRIDFKAGDIQRTKAYDGVEGWIMQNDELRPMPQGEDLEMAEETEFYGELVLARDRGHQLEYLGTETLNGKKVHKIKMTKSKTDEQFYYLNPETHLLEMVAEYSEDVSWKGVLFKTSFDDYREVDGLLFPFKMELFADERLLRKFNTRSIEVNGTMPDSIFSKDQAIIRRNIRQFSEALVSQNYDAVVDAYTADGKIFPNNKPILEGHPALRQYWTPKEGSTYRIISHKITPLEIKIIGNEAYDYGYYEGTSTSEGKESSWKGKYVIVWKKVTPDVWKMYLDIWNRVP